MTATKTLQFIIMQTNNGLLSTDAVLPVCCIKMYVLRGAVLETNKIKHRHSRHQLL